MSETTMLEKVARVIGEAYDGYVDPVATPNRWPVAENAARAVIQALMAPKAEQHEALDACLDAFVGTDPDSRDTHGMVAIRAYRAMLQSILATEEKGE